MPAVNYDSFKYVQSDAIIIKVNNVVDPNLKLRKVAKNKYFLAITAGNTYNLKIENLFGFISKQKLDTIEISFNAIS
jgi:wyosine [tRNA(Phe)-imidazoG37] synthetase (radical SAM superfamily)